MAAAIPWSWWLIVVLVVLYVGAALHTGLAMRRYGRRWWLWFGLSVLLTVIPAVVCSYAEYFRELRRQRRAGSAEGGQVRRCRHCGAVLVDRASDPAAPDRPEPRAGAATCPECGMAVEDESIA